MNDDDTIVWEDPPPMREEGDEDWGERDGRVVWRRRMAADGKLYEIRLVGDPAPTASSGSGA